VSDHNNIGDQIRSYVDGKRGISDGTYGNSLGLSQFEAERNAYRVSGPSYSGGGSFFDAVPLLTALAIGGWLLLRTESWTDAGLVFLGSYFILLFVSWALRSFFRTALGRFISAPFRWLFSLLRWLVIIIGSVLVFVVVIDIFA